ncbi:hypothetical protein KQX54_018378 [Cotesia glomerata]|uniref:Uncharacterized protein n=1 Tax=Cotesia glomerata TaxID=32391 RepID=A0AAV7IAL1_COTGL|nr:hypothetical protein KQX54_018378 [Cotesia glomerata]
MSAGVRSTYTPDLSRPRRRQWSENRKEVRPLPKKIGPLLMEDYRRRLEGKKRNKKVLGAIGQIPMKLDEGMNIRLAPAPAPALATLPTKLLYNILDLLFSVYP